MLRPRIIPCLLIKNKGLVKTINFDSPKYVGDPINAVRIFNEKEVDELLVMLEQYNSGQLTQGSETPLTRSPDNLGMTSLLRLAYAEGELQQAREIEARIQGDLTEEQRDIYRQADANIIEDIIESSRRRQPDPNTNT